MNVSVNVMLQGDDELDLTLEEAADKVLSALKGDKKVDHCQVSVHHLPATGSVGPTPEAPPVPPE